MPAFQYDPAKGRFRAWLLTLTERRIADQFRQRSRGAAAGGLGDETGQGVPIEEIPDPNGHPMPGWSEEELRHGLYHAAKEKAKRRVDAKQYQIFDLCVTRGWPIKEVAEVCRTNRAAVYLAKLRVSRLIARTVQSLRQKEERAAA